MDSLQKLQLFVTIVEAADEADTSQVERDFDSVATVADFYQVYTKYTRRKI